MRKKTILKSIALCIIPLFGLLLFCFIGFVFANLNDERPPNLTELQLEAQKPPTESTFRQLTRENAFFIPENIKEKYTSANGGFGPNANHDLDDSVLKPFFADLKSAQVWEKLDKALQAQNQRDFYPVSALDLINLARVMYTYAKYTAKNGKPEDALQISYKILFLGKKYAESASSLVDILGYFAIQNIGYLSVKSIIGKHAVSADCLRELRGAIDTVRSTDEEFKNALRGEFLFVKQMLELIEIGKNPPGADDIQGALCPPVIRFFFPDVLLYKSNETLRVYAEWYQTMFRHMGDDALTLKVITSPSAKINEIKKGKLSYYPVNIKGRRILSILVTEWEPFFMRRLSIKTMASLTETALALRQYEAENGTFPESLDQLMPKYLGNLPLDYMNRKPLHYFKNIRALWSVGENGNIKNPSDITEKDADLIFLLPPLTP